MWFFVAAGRYNRYKLPDSDRAIDMRVTMERSSDDWRRWQEIKAHQRK
jgi:hypothetical protein